MMAAEIDVTELCQEAEELVASKNTAEAIPILVSIVNLPLDDEGNRDVVVKAKEHAILTLGRLFAKSNMAQELGALIQTTKDVIDIFSKAKAAKLIRELVDLFLDMRASTGNEVMLCQQCIDWAKSGNRVFLRQALEARLIMLYLDTHNYTGALSLASSLLKELKKIDDKSLLVEVQLLESQAYYKIGNLVRARASLTSAKTTANGIYCPPKLQASLDLQSGILHAEEKDFKTSYSYFYEAFESFDSINHPSAVLALKYMLLIKIMLNTPEDVQNIITGKLALRHVGPQIEAMQSIAKASKERSISEFEKMVREYQQEIEGDPVVKSHLHNLYDNLLEQNLLRIIEPFSTVEVDHIAQIIRLPLDLVEKKLSQMILDKTLHGILDQGQGVLVVFDDTPLDQTYTAALKTISNTSKVVDSLYLKSKQLQ
ncbi:hypothetical protein EMCRGX_G012464 [Ephydatia muelleri]|eukprot:Em0004g38a